MIGSELLRYKPEQRYVVADTETEGVNVFYSRPWEVAYSICDAKNVYHSVSEYIWWPDLNVSKKAALITRFDYNHYKQNAKPADEVLERYEKYLLDPSLLIIGHNFYFDGYMYNSWRRALGKKEDWSWMDRMLDTHCLFKAIKKEWKPENGNYRRWQYRAQNWVEKGLKSNLGLVCRELDVKYDPNEAHGALYDIGKTREVWEKIKWTIEV